MPEVTPSEWEDYLAKNPDAHILQTRTWGELKAAFGWKPHYLIVNSPQSGGSLGTQILFRRLPLGFSIGYIARGPVGSHAVWDLLMLEVDRLCQKERAIFLKLEPDGWEASFPPGANGSPDQVHPPDGFQISSQTIQPTRTLVVDLSGSEDQILARMHQKTRYNIRLAQKKGVTVQPSTNLELFHRLLEITGKRDAFGVHSLDYYRQAYDLFHKNDECALLIAEFEGQPLAGLMVFRRTKRAWYFYGASGNENRELMSTYLLQWEAMRWARSQGCTSYDLWGVPDADEPALEAQFLTRSGGLWGVYRFKRGFGGLLQRSPGPWDRVYRYSLYGFYSLWAGRSR